MGTEIPCHFNASYFKRILEHGLRLSNIELLTWDVKDLTVGGENYCSNIYRSNITFREPHQESRKPNEISVIVKSMPKEKQATLSALGIYTKEIVFYLDVMPKIEALMWSLNDDWRLGAKLLLATTVPEETIAFADLCDEGFQLQSRQIGLDVTHATFVMKKMAQYHALTMLMAQRQPEIIIDRYPFGLLNIASIKSEAFKALFGAQLVKLATLLADSPDFAIISKKLLAYHDNFTERVLKSVYPLRGEMNVLNHGDLWVNNLFFSYTNAGTIKEVRFIDFQLCFYGSPGFDINYFLNTSVQLDVLKGNRHRLIDSYFETLLETLKTLPYKKPLPKYTDLLREIQEREAYGFFVAFAFFPLMSMISIDSQDNSLEKLHDEEFARQKIELMFQSNKRTMETLKYATKRLDDLGLLN